MTVGFLCYSVKSNATVLIHYTILTIKQQILINTKNCSLHRVTGNGDGSKTAKIIKQTTILFTPPPLQYRPELARIHVLAGYNLQ